MIVCRKYDPNLIDYSLKINKQIHEIQEGVSPIIKATTDEERKIQAQKETQRASEPDFFIRWLRTGNRLGLSKYSDEQLEEMKYEVERFQRDFERDGIDKDNQMEILAYIFVKLQTKMLYKHPRTLPRNFAENKMINSLYEALIDKYTLCEGMSKAMELYSKLYGIDAKGITMTNTGVLHEMTGIPLENGNLLFIDVANEVGMAVDGRYDGSYAGNNLRRMEHDKVKSKVGINNFGRIIEETLREEPQANTRETFIHNPIYRQTIQENISDEDKIDVIGRVVEKINAHRLRKLVISTESVKIKKGTSTQENLNRTRIQAGIYQATTTPEEITQTAEQYAQENPGQLSPNVRKARGIFARVKEWFKELKEK